MLMLGRFMFEPCHMDEVEFHAPPRESKSKRWLSFHPFSGSSYIFPWIPWWYMTYHWSAGAPVLDPSHPLSSSLRSIGDPSAAPAGHAEGPQELRGMGGLRAVTFDKWWDFEWSINLLYPFIKWLKKMETCGIRSKIDGSTDTLHVFCCSPLSIYLHFTRLES